MSKRITTQGEFGGYERGVSGRVTGAYTGTLVAGAAGNVPITEAVIQASPDNTANVGLGFGVSGNTPFELIPGAAITVPVRRLNLLRVAIGAGDYINYLAFIAA